MKRLFLFCLLPYILFSCSNGESPETTAMVRCSVNFNGNGGTGSSPDTIFFAPGEAVTIPSNTYINEEYRFSGWNTEKNGSGSSYIPGDLITRETDLLLYAMWEQIPTSENGPDEENTQLPESGTDETPDPGTGTGGDPATEPEPEEDNPGPEIQPPVQERYSVHHFFMLTTGKIPESPDETDILKGVPGEYTAAEARNINGFTPRSIEQKIIEPDGSTSVNIYYERIMVRFTFDANGGMGGTVSTAGRYEGPTQGVVPPVRPGYEFIGWSSPIPEKYIESMTFIACWEPKQYTISFDYGNGAAGNLPASRSITFMEEYGELPAPMGEGGLQFLYWSRNGNSTGRVYTDDIYDIAEDSTLYAVWQEADS